MKKLLTIIAFTGIFSGCAEPIKLADRSVPGAHVKVGRYGWLTVTLADYLDRDTAVKEFNKYAAEAAKDNIECPFGSDEVNFTTERVVVDVSEKTVKTKKKGEETDSLVGKTVVSGWVVCKYASATP